MPITEKQRVARRNAIGASEIGALFGVDPFKSAVDVWFQKVHGVESNAGKAAEAGSYLESGLLDFTRDRYGRIRKNQKRKAPGDVPIRANCDAIVVDSGQPVDCKTSGLFGPLIDHWGDEDTDDVPSRVNLQLHAQMLCTDTHTGHVVAFLGGRGFVCYRIERNPKVIDAIIERTKSFWVDNVLAQVMPDGAPPSMDTLKRLVRQPDKVVDLDAAALDLVERHKASQAASTQAGKDRDALKAQLIALLGDAEAGQLPDGRLVTYYASDRAGYTVEPSTTRRLYIRKAR